MLNKCYNYIKEDLRGFIDLCRFMFREKLNAKCSQTNSPITCITKNVKMSFYSDSSNLTPIYDVKS